jgi:hypothetical protein
MSKLPRKRPSAGVIIGILALVVAIAGTAIASAPQGKITADKVKTIVQNLAPSLNVNSAKTAASAKSADQAKIATNVLSANVLADGTMLGSIPDGTTSAGTGIPGIYLVTFPRSLAGCTISGSLATNAVDVPPGEFDVGSDPDRADRLVITTYASGGSFASKAFYVQAVCPG